jgi:hypothetical protein
LALYASTCNWHIVEGITNEANKALSFFSFLGLSDGEAILLLGKE